MSCQQPSPAPEHKPRSHGICRIWDKGIYCSCFSVQHWFTTADTGHLLGSLLPFMLLRSSWECDVHPSQIPHGRSTPAKGIRRITASLFPLSSWGTSLLIIGFTCCNSCSQQIISSKHSGHLPPLRQTSQAGWQNRHYITALIKQKLWKSGVFFSDHLSVCSLCCFMVCQSFLCPSQSQAPAQNLQFWKDSFIFPHTSLSSGKLQSITQGYAASFFFPPLFFCESCFWDSNITSNLSTCIQSTKPSPVSLLYFGTQYPT